MKNIADELLLPEGFKELVAFFDSKDKMKKNVKAEEIQNYLQKNHDFSSGKITGIIRRAKEQKVLVKVSRGIYKINNLLLNDDNSHKKSNVIKQVDLEIDNLVDKIESIVSKQMREMQVAEFSIIKQKIAKLQEVKNMK